MGPVQKLSEHEAVKPPYSIWDYCLRRNRGIKRMEFSSDAETLLMIVMMVSSVAMVWCILSNLARIIS